jgi:hypothetical protein
VAGAQARRQRGVRVREQKGTGLKNQVTIIGIITVIALVLLGLITWGNYNFAKNSPGGNDFLVHWMGTRSLVTEGLNPYSDEVALRIQTMAYGRAAQPGEHELRVAYPLYSVVLFFPFALISDFTLARAVWMTVLEVGLVLLTLLSLRLARWRVHPLMLAVLLLFSIFWYHGLRPLINGNAVVLVALMLVGGLIALRSGADELAGVLFAFSTVKPQVAVLLLAYITFWALSTRRWKVIGWMVGTIALLSASAALFIPGWILDNLREVIRYPAYNPPGSLQAAFKIWWPAWGTRVGWALTGIMALVIVLEWLNHRHAEGRGFVWAACLTLAAGQWSGIQTDPGNFVVLVPAIILVFALLDERWRMGGRVSIILFMVALFVGIWAIFLNTVQYGAQPVQSPVMFMPLPAFLLVTLYWVRWWAVEPPSVWFDKLERL